MNGITFHMKISVTREETRYKPDTLILPPAAYGYLYLFLVLIYLLNDCCLIQFVPAPPRFKLPTLDIT